VREGKRCQREKKNFDEEGQEGGFEKVGVMEFG
jgi:hypothetical protein